VRDAAAAWTACQALAESPRILPHIVATVRALGVVRERRAVELIHLTLTSRLLDHPVSAVLKGPSGVGKSYIVEQVVKLFPPSATHVLSAMSEHALAYGTENLSHVTMVIYEAAGLQKDFASYLMRSLLSEGRIRYETVVKTEGQLEGRVIEREGPTGLIVTTTALALHPENETRMLSVPVTDSSEQTKAVLAALAHEPPTAVDVDAWHALQEWLAAGERRVTVPFAAPLVAAIDPVAVRLRRDVRQVLMLVRAHALLHRATRERDASGRIVATLTDYAAVRRLVEPLVSAGVGATVPRTVRETVAAVAACASTTDGDVTVKAVGTALTLDKSAAWRRVRRAVDDGYLVNLEDRKGRPARLTLGSPLPDDRAVLPPVRLLRDLLKKASPHSSPSLQPCDHGENPLSDAAEGVVARDDGCKNQVATGGGDSSGCSSGCNDEIATATTLQPSHHADNAGDSGAVARVAGSVRGGVHRLWCAGSAGPLGDPGRSLVRRLLRSAARMPRAGGRR
jgi:hypothetical protein